MTRAEVKSFFGSAEGVRARQFPDFKYMFASCAPFEFYWWNSTADSCAPITPVCERVDFVVEIEEEDDAGESAVQVFLLPNKYTTATQRTLISKFHAKTWQMPELRQLANWAADQAFRTHDAR
jgi:hypothetical protein